MRRLAMIIAGLVFLVPVAPGLAGEVTGLPMAQGKTFATLDAYLEHRRTLGAMDLPWYRLEPDGRYRLMTGRGGRFAPPQYYTRAELARQFGFAD